jgi:hypothetical protein
MARAPGWPNKPLGWEELIALAQSPDGWAKDPIDQGLADLSEQIPEPRLFYLRMFLLVPRSVHVMAALLSGFDESTSNGPMCGFG